MLLGTLGTLGPIYLRRGRAVTAAAAALGVDGVDDGVAADELHAGAPTNGPSHALVGFVLILLATASSGFRWAFTQILLTPPGQKDAAAAATAAAPSPRAARLAGILPRLHPVVLLYAISPWGLLALAPAALALEIPELEVRSSTGCARDDLTDVYRIIYWM